MKPLTHNRRIDKNYLQEYKNTIGTNPIEAAGNYCLKTADKALGIHAWREAMQKPIPDSLFACPNRPAWANAVNKVLDLQAPLYAALEFLAPAISRIWVPVLDHPEKYAKYPSVIKYGMVAPALVDIANIAGTIFLSQEFGNGLLLKVAANAGTHMALDLISVAGKGASRIIEYFRLPNSNLEI